MGVTNNKGVWIGWLDLLITPLQSLVITIIYNNTINECLGLAPFWPLYSAMNYHWVLLSSPGFSSYIAYTYPRKCLLITRIHGNMFHNELASMNPSLWQRVCHTFPSNGSTCHNMLRNLNFNFMPTRTAYMLTRLQRLSTNTHARAYTHTRAQRTNISSCSVLKHDVSTSLSALSSKFLLSR
jgi:hypothetical protein